MWQTSDKVTTDTITSVTDKCERDDCRLSARIGETTCVGYAEYYDKQGILHVEDTANSRTTDVDCGKCGRFFKVYHSYGKVKEVTEVTEQVKAEFMTKMTRKYIDWAAVESFEIDLKSSHK